jgi:alpha/beta hydrolase fold
LPGVLHIHGGATVSHSATGPVFLRLRDTIAQTGVAVIGVEFRNGGGALGPYPYPAGLNDCIAALRWVHNNRNVLGMSTFVPVHAWRLRRGGGQDLDNRVQRLRGRRSVADIRVGKFQDEEQVGG